MAQASKETASATRKKNALPRSPQAPSDNQTKGPQVCPSCSRPLEPGMPIPGGALTTGSVPQPPQLQAQAKALTTSTTTTASTVTTTTTSTASTLTTTTITDADGIALIVLAPPPSKGAEGLIAAIKANDQEAFNVALKKTKLSAARKAKKQKNARLMPSILGRELNTARTVDNVLGTQSMTAMMVAAGKGNLACLRLLLEAGADPNICTEDYGSALMHAKTPQCMDILVNNGAKPDLENRYFGTALMRAAYEKLDEKSLDILIKGGASINQMAFSTQLATGLERIVPYRETGPAMWAAMSERRTAERKSSPLMAAACTGNVRGIELLIAAGADLELKGGPRGYTALMIAVAAREPEAVEALLLAKADVNAVGEDGATALYLASSKGNVEIMQMLIDAGAKVDWMDDKGMTTLMYVLYENEINVNSLTSEQLDKVVGLLKKNGAQLNPPMQGGSISTRNLNDPQYGEDVPRYFLRYRAQRAMEKYVDATRFKEIES